MNYVAIDGSLLAFRASAAGEKRTIIATHRRSGNSKEFDNRTAFKEYLKDLQESGKEFEVMDFEIEDVQTPEKPEITLHILKEMVNYILTACKADDYVIWLDNPEDTFRHKLATVQEYKGNRKGLTKPVNLQLVKDHMVLHYKTKIAPIGLEADDMLSIHAWQSKTKEGDRHIACSFDKDQFQCKGWIFDFRKDSEGTPLMKEPKWIEGLGHVYLKSNSVKGEGRKFLYAQALAGDTADAYKPNKLAKKRFGDKATFKLLEPLKTDKECWQAIVDTYKSWYPYPVSYTTWDGKDLTRDWMEILQEYVDLAHMRRWEDDRVSVKQTLDKLGVEYGE